jgi:hypothetical protein
VVFLVLLHGVHVGKCNLIIIQLESLIRNALAFLQKVTGLPCAIFMMRNSIQLALRCWTFTNIGSAIGIILIFHIVILQLFGQGQMVPTTHNIGRILSTFEQVEQQSQSQRRRAPSKCTSCGGVGYTMRSRNCPISLRASIAEESRLLREQELLQAAGPLTTPRPAKRVLLETPDSATTAVLEQTTPFTLRIQPQCSESIVSSILDSPQSVFQTPPLIPGVEYSMAISSIAEQP